MHKSPARIPITNPHEDKHPPDSRGSSGRDTLGRPGAMGTLEGCATLLGWRATLGQPLHGLNGLGPAGKKCRTLVVGHV